jgi:hypothetical protein
VSWFVVLTIFSYLLQTTSQVHPLPNTFVVDVANAALNFSKEPNYSSIAVAKVPTGTRSGAGDVSYHQNNE